jgi:hypothetical protein
MLAGRGDFRPRPVGGDHSDYGGVTLTDKSVSYAGPTVLWRLRDPDGHVLRAMLIPGAPASTLVYFLDDQFERGENFSEWEPALQAAARLKEQMLAEGWKEIESAHAG